MTRQLIAAAYARTSSDRDDSFKISSQLDGIFDYAEENSISIPKEYVFEETFSGKTASRPQYNKIRQLIKTGAIDMLIVYDASRFARAMDVSVNMLDELFDSKIELHLVSWQSEVRNINSDRDHFYDESLYADKERRKIVERLSRGKRKKVKDGIWIGSAVNKYGYDKRGSKKSTEMFIVEEEAHIIRMIFDLYLREHKNPTAIAKALQEAGYPTPSQSRGFWKESPYWNEGMIYRILRDEAYTGKWYVNRKQVVPSPVTKGKVTMLYKPKEDATLLEFPELRIIDQESFDTARKLLAEGKARYSGFTGNEYLMASRAFCSCGFRMVPNSTKLRNGKRYAYYNRSSSKACTCGVKVYPVGKVDSLVFDWTWNLLQNPQAVLEGYKRIQQAQLVENQEALERVTAARARLDSYESELKTYAELYVKKLITIGIFEEKKKELDRSIQAAEFVVAEYEESLNRAVLTDCEIKQKVDAITAIKAEIDKLDTLEFKHKRKLIELLNITSTIALDNGKPYLEIVWYGEVQAEYWLAESVGDSVSSKASIMTYRIPCMPMISLKVRFYLA
jgi:site-specific DNA recombinase